MRQEDYFHSFLPTQDHTESREKDGVRWLVWHPYNISLFDLTLLDTKCKEHGLHFEVHPWSWYYPGATFMVAVRARRDNDL